MSSGPLPFLFASEILKRHNVCLPSGEAISFDLQHRKGSVIVVISFVIAVIEIVDNLLLANDCIHKENSHL